LNFNKFPKYADFQQQQNTLSTINFKADMNNWIDIIKKFQAAMLDQPFLASIFITDFAILLFHRPPFFFSLLMVAGLVAMSMYFGQKLALFNLARKAWAKPQAAIATMANVGVTTVTEPVPTKTAAKPKAKPKT
jgi:hypothetical protein